ncbi:MAG: hypothetical protein WCP92_07695 [bacterium]
MVQEFVEVAKQKYPDFNFVTGEYFGDKNMKDMFDIVMCCGALNSNFGDVMEYRKKNIKKMFTHCNYCTVFNMA